MDGEKASRIVESRLRFYIKAFYLRGGSLLFLSCRRRVTFCDSLSLLTEYVTDSKYLQLPW